MEGLDINRIKLLLLTFLILTLCSGIGAAAEVRPGGSIQAAVNSANPDGDTIVVYPGTYTENIEITKNNLVLMAASPNPDDTKIVPKDINKSVIFVKARPNLVIKGFTISGAATDLSGIYLEGCNGCTIENNKFLNDALGVYVKNSVNTTIRNNLATRTSEAGKIGRGVNIEGSEITAVLSNTISNHRYGIYFSGSQSNTISGNSISQCADNGIVIEKNSNNNVLESNTVSSNGKRGIYLKDSGKSSLKNNFVSSNGGNGIEIEVSSGNKILDNTISGIAKNTNIHGLFVNTSKDDYLQNNTISNCEYGVVIRNSENDTLIKNNAYDNFRGFYLSHKSSRNTLSGNKANSNNNGIIMELGANNNILENNEANSNSASGIALDSSTSNKISNNIASSNDKGIYLLSSSNGNTLSGNTVNSNKNDGILLQDTSENNVTNNIINLNKRYGIYAVNSNNINVDDNTVKNSLRGIYLDVSAKNVVSKNIVTDCSLYGLYFMNSSDNRLSKNTINGNGEGITLSSSVNNEISGNKVSSNGYGIFMCPRSTENRVYDNYFNNANNANIKNSRSVWNMKKTPGRNIVGGPTLGGNFWGTPAGLGFSDINSDKDADEDGIIDIPYVSDNGNVTDEYPLIRFVLPVANFNANPTKGFVPLTVEFTDLSKDATSISWDINGDRKPDNTNKSFVHVYDTPGIYNVILTASNKNGTDSKTLQIIAEEFKVLPVADFSASVMSGYAPLSVQFTDLSQNAVSRSWNFGDGATSTEQNPMYIYSATGTYTVSLAATNENGTVSKTATITVMDSSSSGGSSGGKSRSSGSGGGGGSPEPARNVQVKEISQVHVASGKPVKFDFAKNATCVVYVTFDSKKTAGKTTAIAEQLKEKSTLVSELNSSEKSSEKPGEIYRYFNLWVGNAGFATSKNIENPVICFKVEKTWLQDKNIDKASIKLNRYDDKKWSQLPVKQLKEDNKYLYFTAETPGFSFFAITGKAVEKETGAEKKSGTDSELGQNKTASETEQGQKSKQETGDKSTSIPGFEVLWAVACLITVFLYKRK